MQQARRRRRQIISWNPVLRKPKKGGDLTARPPANQTGGGRRVVQIVERAALTKYSVNDYIIRVALGKPTERSDIK